MKHIVRIIDLISLITIKYTHTQYMMMDTFIILHHITSYCMNSMNFSQSHILPTLEPTKHLRYLRSHMKYKYSRI